MTYGKVFIFVILFFTQVLVNNSNATVPITVNKKLINQTISSSNKKNELKIWDDGTAYARGGVEDHNLGCTVDGACYLRLQVENREVRVIYNEGDVPERCVNNQADHAQRIKKGDSIKAFGAYNKRGSLDVISTCGSTDFFIRHVDEGTPLGPVTERFFDEVAQAKSDGQKRQFEQSQKRGNWEIYQNPQFGYEFSYPATWSMPQTSPDAPFTIQYYDFSSPNNNWYKITLGYVSEAQLATMGIDYCGANPNDQRCEIKRIGTLAANIDWGDNRNKSALAKIINPKGGMIIFALEPNTPEAKTFFVQILNTFKFTK